MIRVFALALIIGISLPSFAGGPWLKKKNSGLIQFQTNLPIYPYSSMLMGRFIKDIQGVNRKVFNSDYSLYLEYGITDRLNIIASLPFKYVSTGELTDQQYFPELLDEGSLFGFSNSTFSIKYGLLDKKVKIAVSLISSLNTINQDLDKGLATGFDANSIGLMAHVGRSSDKHYGFLEVGFHKYSNHFSDLIEINLEHGFHINSKWTLGFALNAKHSLENGSYKNTNLEQTGLYPNNQGFAAISMKIVYETDKGFGINAALPLIPIKFKYIGYNGAIALGVYKKF